jgi:hypothetical protein
MPYSGDLTRNIVQCLNDFDIPLYLSHTIVDIQGKDRVEKAIVAEIGPDRKPIPGTEMEFDVEEGARRASENASASTQLSATVQSLAERKLFTSIKRMLLFAQHLILLKLEQLISVDCVLVNGVLQETKSLSKTL